MAERRMFAKTIIDSDAFLDMPLSAQALYFHLSMRADDDGFLNNAKKIMRTINSNQNDYDLLVAKSFIIQFDDGICVIKHWRINNYLRNDRYKPTIYKEQKDMLEVKDNGRYSLISNNGIPTGTPDDSHVVYQCETQVRLGKDSIGKDSIDNINTPLTPLGEDKPKTKSKDNAKYDYGKHSNVENACYILNYLDYKEKDWLIEHKEVWECIRGWLEYKDERKDKYKGEKSLSKLFTMFVNSVRDYGLDPVSLIVDESIAAGYQGITWDKLKRYPKVSYNSDLLPKNKPTEEPKEEIDIDYQRIFEEVGE